MKAQDKKNNSYFGGKNGNGTYQNIINEIPQCKIYVEPMVGGGGILKNLNLPEITVINDLDSGVIDNYSNVDQGQDIRVYNVDYKIVCDIYDSKESVIYFDPPYHFETRKSQQKRYFAEWETKEHIEFLNYVRSLQSKIIISHYPFYLYDKVLKDWRTKEFLSTTRSGQVVEKLYMNFEKPKALQDYRYIGEDFTDRQRIKRQNKRLFNKIAQLPLYQRQLLLSEISILQNSHK